VATVCIAVCFSWPSIGSSNRCLLYHNIIMIMVAAAVDGIDHAYSSMHTRVRRFSSRAKNVTLFLALSLIRLATLPAMVDGATLPVVYP
jgi:hypothetical protein